MLNFHLKRLTFLPMYNFTPEDLLQYHYQELGHEEMARLEEALQNDWALNEKLSVIKDASMRLNKSFYSPREQTVRRILNYAMETTVITEG
jgi:hypothetical protein